VTHMAKSKASKAGASKAQVLDTFEREECSEHVTKLAFGGRTCRLAGMPDDFSDEAFAALAWVQEDAVRVNRKAVTTPGGVKGGLSYLASPARLSAVLLRYAAANSDPTERAPGEARPEVT